MWWLLAPLLQLVAAAALLVWAGTFLVRRVRALPQAERNPLQWSKSKQEKKKSALLAVFISGCDSGMGKATAERLSRDGYVVFAGVFEAKNTEKNSTSGGSGAGQRKPGDVVYVALDVTREESIAAALGTVEKEVAESDLALLGVINCAGIGFTGAFEGFPFKFWQKQIDVNLFGYVRLTSAFLPLLRAGVDATGLRARVLCVGTGGGVPALVPACFPAYMASKWGVEAMIQCLRVEFAVSDSPIDAAMINPGVTNPTNLMPVGLGLLDDLYRENPDAKKRWKRWTDNTSEMVQTTPYVLTSNPENVAAAMSSAMQARIPMDKYLVGLDSRLSSIVGMMPTLLREKMMTASLYAVDDAVKKKAAAGGAGKKEQ